MNCLRLYPIFLWTDQITTTKAVRVSILKTKTTSEGVIVQCHPTPTIIPCPVAAPTVASVVGLFRGHPFPPKRDVTEF